MKARTHIALLVGFFASMVLYTCMLSWNASQKLSELKTVLLLSFCAVPAFLIQLWLCQLKKARWTRWIPLCILSFFALAGAAYAVQLVGNGWDALFGGIILCWCLAPAAGCALGWMTCGEKLHRSLGAAALVILLMVYAVLRIMGGPICFELIDLPALIVLAVGTWLLLGKDRKCLH